MMNTQGIAYGAGTSDEKGVFAIVSATPLVDTDPIEQKKLKRKNEQN